MASAAFGEPFHSGFSRSGDTDRRPFRRGQFNAFNGPILWRRYDPACSAGVRQRDRHSVHLRGLHDSHVRGHMMGILRVSKEGEVHGLDLHEHGISAYPEYVISSSGRPVGMPVEPVAYSVAPVSDPVPRLTGSP